MVVKGCGRKLVPVRMSDPILVLVLTRGTRLRKEWTRLWQRLKGVKRLRS